MLLPRTLDHIVLLVADLAHTEKFYACLLGPPAQRTDSSFMYFVGQTRVFFAQTTHHDQGFDKERIGLNHLAFGVGTLAELQTIERQLEAAGIAHSGIAIDRYSRKEFIWLDDPDGMRVEFYLRAAD
jgi:glyoxylase I family protein